MITLSIDTSCNTCQCALTENGVLLGKYAECDKRTHSVKLLPAIDRLVKNAGKRPSDIDLIGVTNGPGSYTGMRIGVSTAKTIAFGTEAPLVGINTMDFLAESVMESAPAKKADIICTLINARNMRVYGCLYNMKGERISEGKAEELQEICGEAVSYLKDRGLTGKILFTGDGSVDYREEIQEAAGDRALFADEAVVFGVTEKMNEMAEKIYQTGENKEKLTAAALNIDYYRAYFKEDTK